MIGGVTVKNFDNFREYMSENSSEIANEIQNKVDKYLSENNIENLILYTNAYTQVAIMKMLEEYHNWLNSKS